MNSNTKNKFVGIVVIVIALVFLAINFLMPKSPVSNLGVTKQATTTNDSKKEFKIVAFGDSLTAGLGVDLKDSYPSILENILNTDTRYSHLNRLFKIINMGVSGDTTTGGLERVDFVLAQKPDLVLLELGANDMLQSLDPTITSANLITIIKKITDSKVPVLILGMESASSNGLIYKKDFDAIYPKLARTYNLTLVPFFLAGVALVPSLNTADGIHPNRTGYEKIISENVLPILGPELEKLIK